jgi:hypothetical protein
VSREERGGSGWMVLLVDELNDDPTPVLTALGLGGAN